MKLQLGDNATDGIRFLLLGGGVLLAFRLLYVGLDLWLSPPPDMELPVLIKTFQNGYLLLDRTTLVVGGPGVMERVAIAVLMTLFSTAAIALLALVVSTITRTSKSNALVIGLRAGMVASGIWWLFAALAWPPHTVRVAENELVRTIRPAVLDALSLPWPGESITVPMETIFAFEHRSFVTDSRVCGFEEKAEAVSAEIRVELACIVPQGKDCELEKESAEQRLERLASLLSERIR